MPAIIDLRVLELLCSRLCHELISPVTAINNGMELLADGPAESLDEIRELLVQSAGEAARRLQFYRVAYGFGGENGGWLELDSAGRLVDALARGGKVAVDWPGAPDTTLPREHAKVLLNAAVIGLEALPRGGTLVVRVEATGGTRLALDAFGQGAGLRADVAAALGEAADAETLGPRSVHAYFTAQLIAALDGRLEIDGSVPDRLALTVRL